MTEDANEIVYASRLRRLPVVDPEGAAIGRGDDVVVGPAGQGLPPPVLGFVVTVPGRRIFVNAARVRALEPDGLRLTGGAVNLRRFAPRPHERLVLGQLVDTPLGQSGEVVNDVGIRPHRGPARGWEVAVVDLVGARGGLRRRRERRSASWEFLAPLLGSGAGALADFRDLHPSDAAQRLAALPPAERVRAARALDDEQLADVLQELPEATSSQLLDALQLDRAADVLEAMEPDDAADLLGEYAPARRGELLAAMEPDEAAPLRRLLTYPHDTAGGLMTPEPVVLAESATVAEALARLRDPDLPAALAAQVFVTQAPTETPTGPFLGTVSFQRLLREPPSRPVAACRDAGPEPIGPDLPQDEVAVRLSSYDLLALPVVDDGRRLLGAVTVDDALQHLLAARGLA